MNFWVKVLGLGQLRRSEKEPLMDPDEILMSPSRKKQINESVKRSHEQVLALEEGRRALQDTPKLLEQVRHEATGIIGADLLADRPGRPHQHRSHQ